MATALFLLLIIANLLFFGHVIATRFLTDEKRVVVTIPFGLMVGTCVYGYLVIINRYLFDWPIAVLMSGLELFSAGVILGWSRRDALLYSRLVLGTTKSQAAVVALLLTGVVVLTGLVWFNDAIANGSGITSEARFWHGGITASLARGNFPLHDIMEPDFQYFYRWPFHAVAATLMRVLDIDGALAMGLVNIWTMGLLCAGAIALFYRQRFTAGQAITATVILLFAGSASWLSLGGDPTQYVLYQQNPYSGIRNYIIGGSNFDMLQVNPTVPFGLLSFLATFWMWHEWRGSARRTSGFVVLSIVTAYMVATSEASTLIFFPTVLTYLVVISVQRRALQVKEMTWMIALAMTSLVLSLPLGGVLTGTILRPQGGTSASIVLNTEHFGSVVTAPLIARLWVPIGSIPFLFGFGFLPILLAVLTAAAWKVRLKWTASPLLYTFIAMGLFAFAASMFFYPENHPNDQYRFNQIAYVFLTVGAYLALCRLAPYVSLMLRNALYATMAVLVTIWVTPTLRAAINYASNSNKACLSESDDRAATYFRNLSWAQASRALVLNGATRSFEPQSAGEPTLYGCTAPTLMSHAVMQYGGMGIPLGHDLYGHSAKYNPLYQRANTELDRAALRELQIDHIYVDPVSVTNKQETELSRMVAEGLIHKVYDANGRVIYSLSSSSSAVDEYTP